MRSGPRRQCRRKGRGRSRSSWITAPDQPDEFLWRGLVADIGTLLRHRRTHPPTAFRLASRSFERIVARQLAVNSDVAIDHLCQSSSKSSAGSLESVDGANKSSGAEEVQPVARP
jgi:hypothetical protein